MEQTPIPAGSTPVKSSKTQPIGILMLVSGIVNIMVGVGGGIAFLLSIIMMCCSPIYLLPVALGAIEIYYSTKLLSSSGEKLPFGRIQTVVILEICSLLAGNFISMILGIINLVLMNDPETRSSFL